MSRPHLVLLVNLLQDVNILQPLVPLAAAELDVTILFLVSHKFAERDTQGLWRSELHEIAAQADAAVLSYDSEYAAVRALAGKRGVLVAASESDLSAHAQTHNVFRAAPPGFLRVTLQHGFECVGFLQNRDHYKAHGRTITFAADVVCGWTPLSAMRSMAASERSKYFMTGPSALLQPAPKQEPERTRGGLVCENLHSVRMKVSGDFKASFMDTFFAFCSELEQQGRHLALRPHPGGQYVLKQNIDLPANVNLNNLPMYKVDLRRFDYGISAPSSVVVDMVLAGIPTAVWQDENGIMDAGNYAGLCSISGLQDWLEFERDARLRRDQMLQRQAGFLQRSGLLTDRPSVRERFLRVLSGALGLTAVAPRPASAAQRILFVANAIIPTLQLSFIKPLSQDVAAGRMTTGFITGEEIKRRLKAKPADRDNPRAETEAWLRQTVADFDPTTIVFCRYSDVCCELLVDLARERDTPVIFHVDDDLLNVPLEIGEAKYRMHNAPERLATVRHLLTHADLVYASTRPLMKRFRELGFTTPMTVGPVYCAASVLNPAVQRPVRKIGYMGFDHAHDLELILPALVSVLRRRPDLGFELFGSIPKPAALDEFGDRVTVIAPVRVYAEFLQKFASLNWDIGLCPLASTPFNRVKANTKWVEYTSVGAAVIATRGMVYDDCCADGCGELAGSVDEWVRLIDGLCGDGRRRFQMVQAAQKKLQAEYSDAQLRRQVLEVFRQVRAVRAAKPQPADAGAADLALWA